MLDPLAAQFTLVIPTYNRPQALAALLEFLERQRARFPVVILDSSHAAARAENRRVIERVSLAVRTLQFDPEIRPFDKFREGVDRIDTPFCQMCADDDLVLVEGIEQCISRLASDPRCALAHGYYFMFLHEPGRGTDLLYILYFSPDNSDDDPVWRLHTLFRNYQALTYGVYRTPVLQRVLHAVTPVKSMLARELLSSAIATVHGTITRLKCFTHGRSAGPSEHYSHWHPLEWLIRSPEELLAEYGVYRAVLIDEVMQTPANERSRDQLERCIDLIHYHYLLRHTPPESADFVVDSVIRGRSFDAIWRAPEVQVPLTRVPYLPEAAVSSIARVMNQVQRTSNWLLRGLTRTAGHRHDAAEPREVYSNGRKFRLHRRFLQPDPTHAIQVTDADIHRLLSSLEDYRAA